MDEGVRHELTQRLKGYVGLVDQGPVSVDVYRSEVLDSSGGDVVEQLADSPVEVFAAVASPRRVDSAWQPKVRDAGDGRRALRGCRRGAACLRPWDIRP